MSGQSGSGVPTRIVVGTDGSATAERAVRKATALAKAVGAELIIISAFNNRGAANMMLKDFQAALADFNKAISLNEKYADAYDNRGRVKHVLGDDEGACADWQSAYTNGLEASKDLIIKYCK